MYCQSGDILSIYLSYKKLSMCNLIQQFIFHYGNWEIYLGDQLAINVEKKKSCYEQLSPMSVLYTLTNGKRTALVSAYQPRVKQTLDLTSAEMSSFWKRSYNSLLYAFMVKRKDIWTVKRTYKFYMSSFFTWGEVLNYQNYSELYHI